MSNETKESVKFNVSMKKDIFDKIEQYADDFGLSRSAFMAFACMSYINSQEAVKQMSEMNNLMRQIASSHNMNDDYTQDKLHQFESICKALGCADDSKQKCN